MEFIKNKRALILLILLIGLFISSDSIASEVSWPSSPMGTEFPTSSISVLVKYIYDWGITLGGLAAFISLIVAGFLYLTSVGNPAKMKDAQDRAIWAIGGLALLLGSWLILNTINPQLTTLKINPLDFSTTGAFCKTANDCKNNCENDYGTDEICKNNCINYKCSGEGGEEGICYLEFNPGSSKACTSVKVYKNTNSQGDSFEIFAEDKCPLVDLDPSSPAGIDFNPHSSMGFVDGIATVGCGGELAIYRDDKCVDRITDLSVTSPIFPEGNIKSIKLFSF